MDSKITSTLSRKIPIILKYKNGQTNVCEKALNREDLNNIVKIYQALEIIYKQANYKFESSKITTAILVQEE